MNPQELAEQLRKFSSHLARHSRTAGSELCSDAADELVRLQAELARFEQVPGVCGFDPIDSYRDSYLVTDVDECFVASMTANPFAVYRKRAALDASTNPEAPEPPTPNESLMCLNCGQPMRDHDALAQCGGSGVAPKPPKDETDG